MFILYRVARPTFLDASTIPNSSRSLKFYKCTMHRDKELSELQLKAAILVFLLVKRVGI